MVEKHHVYITYIKLFKSHIYRFFRFVILAWIYLCDDEYLFTGDTIWFGADGGYSFISTLAEDNRLAVQSLEKLEKILRDRKKPVKIITGHTGWTDDLDFAFRHRTEICKPFVKKYTDPSAPYDGYVEDDDTEEKARSIALERVKNI